MNSLLEIINCRSDILNPVKEQIIQLIDKSNKLQISEKHLINIINLIGDPIFVKNQESCFILVNNSFCKMLGMKREDIIGKTLVESLPFNQMEHFLKMDKEVLESEQDNLSEELLTGHDGKLLTILTKKTCYIDEHGNKFIVGVIHDVTEQKKKEEALYKREVRLKAIYSASSSGILIHDNGIIVDCNEELSKMTGYLEMELIGKNELFFIAEESKNVVMNNLLSQYNKAYEVMGVHKNGGKLPMRLKNRVITYEGKKLNAIEFRDITELKRKEEERLKNQKLESLGILAGGIAHDFNNLLTGITGNLSLLEDENDTTNRKKLIVDAIKAATQASNLSRKLLAFAKGGVPETVVGSVAKIVKEAVEFAVGNGHPLICKFNLAKDLSLAKIDVGQIYQVFQNLAINAIQATQKMSTDGMINVTANNVELSPDSIPELPSGGEYVRVEIKDNGIGISKDILTRIFDPYFTTKTEGSGLGLTVTHTVVKNHGGVITVESILGKGTTFCVYLPAIKIAQEEGVVKNIYNFSTRSFKILVMEDEASIRKMLQIMLKKLGHQVVLTKNGQEALAQYTLALNSHNPFDLVILDLTIQGGMGGAETIKQLQEINPAVLAIVSSGYSNDMPSEFVATLGKPYTMKELQTVISEVARKFNL